MEEEIKTSGRVNFIIVNSIRLILVLGFIGGYYSGRKLVFTMSLLGLLLTFVPFFLSKVFKKRIPAETELIVVFFIYGLLFLGEVRGLFAGFWWWDSLLNLIAAVALGFVGLTIMYVLYEREIFNASPLIIVIFAFSFAFAIGGLWEIFEFGLDTFFGFNMQKGLTDTMSDMIVDAIGAFLVSIGGYFHIRNGKKNPVSSIVVKIINKNPKIFKSLKRVEQDMNKLFNLIDKGESAKVEFKSSLRTNLYTNEFDKRMEHSVLKTIVAYLNSQGGILLVGVGDNKEILGLEHDKFPSKDKMSLYFTNLLKEHIGNEYLPYINHEILNLKNKDVLKIECKPSNKRTFLKLGKEEEFYIRNGAASIKISGSELLDYVKNKFGNS